MLILDKPYISDLLEKTALKNNFSVLENDSVKELGLNTNLNYVKEIDAIEQIKKEKNPLLYSNSENSINWITKNLGFTDLPQKINLFKDKVKFRQLISEIYPDFYFKELAINELKDLNISTIKMPFIIKPSVGFLSMGVYPVNNENEWINVLKNIETDMDKFKDLFPIEVMDSSKFIIEEIIAGEEFAVDAYFNNNGEPVILNILKHPFASEKDVSDRLYFTSKVIIKNHLAKFEDLLKKIGKLADLKNFPLHIEMRVNNDKIVPIEINPMRFAGWCTTDLAYYAYGINVYECYLNQQEPNWEIIFKQTDDAIYYLTIAEVPTSIDRESIKNLNYKEFLNNIKEPLEIRKIDYKKHPLFAMVFAKTEEHDEIANLLNQDLTKYIEI